MDYSEQPMPTEHTAWEDSVQCKLIQALTDHEASTAAALAPDIKARARLGWETYGTYLGVGNPGRDAERDLRDELLDAMVYSHERYLATGKPRYWNTVLRLAYELHPPTFQPIAEKDPGVQELAQELAAVLGVSVSEAAAALSRIVEKFDKPWQKDRIAEVMARIEKRQEERWRTDPLNLMEWLTDESWRWLAFGILQSLTGALNTLAEWVCPEKG